MRTTAQMLKEAIGLAAHADCVFLAMTGDGPSPVVIPIEKCRHEREERILARAWTEIPVEQSRSCPASLLVWHAPERRGFQIAGRTTGARQAGVLDGYSPFEAEEHFIQEEREIIIEVDSVAVLRAGVKAEVRE
jgi:hypothetical protein